MTRSPRFMQDAVIGMAILVVILALWRLHSRPRLLGGLGAWADTNVLGAATMSLLPGGSGQGGGGGGSLSPITPISGNTNETAATGTNTNASVATLSPSSGLASHSMASNQLSGGGLSTNHLDTNGPVTVIAMEPSELGTPPGVSTAANVPEAAALERRLGEVSAKGGDIQISLSWQNFNDLDLHCIDPSGEEIFFSNKRSRNTGGELDVDSNAHPQYTKSPVENIYWPAGGAPAGLYRISVVYYAQHDAVDTSPFLVRTIVQGQTNFFRSTISFLPGAQSRKLICNLRYNPSNPNPAQRYVFVR